MINARAETLAEKPAFREALEKRRCVIPADGFYEWRKNPDGTKTPIYTTLKSLRGFAFAGLWESWKGPDGKIVTTCTIITTAPNALLAPIHNRMPAILSPEGVRQWLDPGPHTAEELLAQVKPFPAEEMQSHPVSRAMNAASYDGPELITPVEEPSLKPGSAAKARRGKRESPNQGSLF
jgi:putative SOS response-associated peptidase YedK